MLRGGGDSPKGKKRFRSFSVSWLLGFLASKLLGSLMYWFRGFLVSKFLGILVSACLGFLVLWKVGFLGF